MFFFFLFFFCSLCFLFSFILNVSRLLQCLIVVESWNLLLFFVSVLNNWDSSRVFLIILIVVFTIEVVFSLSILTRLWHSSRLLTFIFFW
nr:NADH dehydrogenase subunit 4L [Haematoloechus sp. CW13H]